MDGQYKAIARVVMSVCSHDGGPIYKDECGLWRHITPTSSGYRPVTCRLAYPKMTLVDVTESAEPIGTVRFESEMIL